MSDTYDSSNLISYNSIINNDTVQKILNMMLLIKIMIK